MEFLVLLFELSIIRIQLFEVLIQLAGSRIINKKLTFPEQKYKIL